MNSVAVKCKRIVQIAAEPTYVDEKIKERKRRSFNRLRLFEFPNGDSLHHKAWNNQGGPSHLAVLQEQADKVGLVLPPPFHAVIADLQREIASLRQIDAPFHAFEIQHRCDEIEKLMRMLDRR